ncbi:hypothetical protein CXB77_02480 [Chromatium okenii]|uniref:Uncharacterized protein n=1 Tax=Chromatium okenii TaxID=61644 RepID=A0A2S7XV16_9GAMM|nr:hypothetical protein CXB77_02830 [Chromatium okenii]PQJ97403.1 hypothetical protein CXB77_02480 [Chromatium okenii]
MSQVCGLFFLKVPHSLQRTNVNYEINHNFIAAQSPYYLIHCIIFFVINKIGFYLKTNSTD